MRSVVPVALPSRIRYSDGQLSVTGYREAVRRAVERLRANKLEKVVLAQELIANTPEAIYCTKVGTAEADLVIACDAIVAANKATLAVMREGRTFVALNTHGSPTANLVNDANWHFPGAACESAEG